MLEKIQNNPGPWYHKQFHAFPFTLGCAAVGVIAWTRKHLVGYPSVGHCFYEQDVADWYWEYPALLRARKKLIARHLTNDQFFLRFEREQGRALRRFIPAVARFLSFDMSTLSDGMLWKRYAEVLHWYYTVWGWGGISEPFLGAGEDWLQDAVGPELESRFGKHWRREFDILATPQYQSFSSREHQSLLRLAAMLIRRSDRGKFARALRRHTMAFYWVEDNYSVSRNHDEQTFFTRARGLMRRHPEQLLQEERAKHRARMRKKATVLSLMSPKSRRLIALADLLAGHVDQRKSCTFRMARVWFAIVNEVSRRYRIPKQELLYLTNKELERALKNATFDRATLRERRQRCLIITTPSGEHIFSGTAIDAIKKEQFEDVMVSGSEVRGISASVGRARGIVRIVATHDEIAKLKTGEILVANQTTPDYISAMRRAAAIVTEQGGITSHAAVVSRELGKPCIIGTGTATKIFKTGDRVDVDADKGIVRKLRSV